MLMAAGFAMALGDLWFSEDFPKAGAKSKGSG